MREATRLYASGGHAGLSFGLLAERAGLQKATVFHYFPNKDAVVYAVFDSFGRRLESAAMGWFDPPPASYASRLDRLIASLVDFYGADPLNARILCHGLLESERVAPPHLTGTDALPIFRRFIERFVAFIEGGIAAGELHPDRPQATILSIGGLILFEFMVPERSRRSFASGTANLEARKAEIIRIVRRAVVRPRARLPRRRRSPSR